jgi:hypothetical protein
MSNCTVAEVNAAATYATRVPATPPVEAHPQSVHAGAVFVTFVTVPFRKSAAVEFREYHRRVA